MMKSYSTRPGSSRNCEAGFSLIEMLLSVLVLVIVMTAVFKQIDIVQRHSKNESMKLDLTQESRAFADQFARDLHMSGYPSSKQYQSNGGPTDKTLALGLVAASPTSIRFEGDVYGDGNVYSVLYSYFQSDPNDGNCPCLRRSVQFKQNGDPVYVTGDPALGGKPGQAAPLYYTEVQNLIDPTGMAQPIFTFYEANGTQIPVPAGGINIETAPATMQQIDAVKVNLNTRSAQTDPQTGQKMVLSISTIAELEN